MSKVKVVQVPYVLCRAGVLGDVLLGGVEDDERVHGALARDLVLVRLLHRARTLEPRHRHVGLAQIHLGGGAIFI